MQNNFFTFGHRLASGAIKTVEIHPSPIHMAGKTVLFSLINDITGRKLAEDSMKESQGAVCITVRPLDGLFVPPRFRS
ncbi:MAG: hypothetical protein NTV68_07615 [Methanomicrobiales archaeon]|nr:hypothetical protein [Methanomicrobiales archaeon]